MKKTAFVILHYGNWNVTRECVESIMQMKEQEYIQVLLVDNDETSSVENGEQTWLDAYENVMVLVNRGDHGFSHANNLGYRFAREQCQAEFILVLNNDIIFTQKDFLSRLHYAYRRHACHVLGPGIIKRSNHEPQNPMDTRLRTREEAKYTIRMNALALKTFPAAYPALCVQERKAREAALQEKQEKLDDYRNVQKQVVLFGACLIFTPLFVEKETDAFLPETQFYYEEYLLALRCLRQDYTMVYDPVMKVYHESGSATNAAQKTGKAKMRFRLKHTLESCSVYLQELTK
ncbi:MAG: glycosyltransferase family 2 protein [Lachnospiraceae bacterium]|nr:glycosyltransferase family 2 protein [Lachnospiraceae bacterium]